MRATVMYGAGDVRVEEVPDAKLIEPTDALVHVSSAAMLTRVGLSRGDASHC